MSHIYLIPGLGADSRIYRHIELSGYEVVSVDWIEPYETDTLASYSQKLIKQFNITYNSIIIGNSMGGMVAIEIAKLIPVEKVILISSIRTIDEAPGYFGLFKKLPIYKLIPGKLLTLMGFLVKPLFGRMSDADAWLFSDMLKQSSPVFLKWAMGAVVKWDNRIVPPNVYQITGDKDLVFPYRKLKEAEIIKGGTHIMIFDRDVEVNKFLKGVLSK